MSKTAPRKKAPAKKSGNAGLAPDDALPDLAEVAALFTPVRNFLRGREHERVRNFLDRLSLAPPQVLLLEGGTANDRLAAAHYFCLKLNCEAGNAPAPGPRLPGLPGLPEAPETATGTGNAQRPCLACAACLRMISHLHRDCFFLDGTAASIKIDDVRALREVLGEPPREARSRVVIFREAQALVEAAANALLKSFEEPRPGTVFLLLAPQRERLLPTLVSRSFCLTLPWPKEEDPAHAETLPPWEAALCSFLATGSGLFELSGARGAVDAPLVHAIAGLCRRAVAAAILHGPGGPEPGRDLRALFGRLPQNRLRMAEEALAECQDSLIYGVNPALVLEWLATRLFLLMPRAAVSAAR